MDENSLFAAVKAALSKAISLPKRSGDLVLHKSADGQYNLLGKFSNRWRDVDFHANPLNGGEIVTSAAHEEFAKWLDKNPQHALELWSFHHWGTARKSRANWWDWSGNSFYMNWPLTEEEAKAISSWMLDNEPGMSFGFYAFGTDNEKGLIKKYRAFEASILPKQYAANPWASFSLSKIQENDMAFKPEKRKTLVKMHGEDFVKELEKDDEEMAQALDAAGVDTKEVTPEAAEVVAEATDAPFATQKEVVTALERIEGAFSDVVKTLVAKVESLENQLKTLTDTQVAEAKVAAAPLSILASYMPKSILEAKPEVAEAKGTAQISGTSSLARSAPKTASKRNGVALTLDDIKGGKQ